MNTGNGKSRKVALILACIPHTGWLGIHRMYLGYTGIGILQFLTAGGMFIWWIYDIVKIARGKMTDKSGRPLIGNPVVEYSPTPTKTIHGTKKYLVWSIINTSCFFFTLLPIAAIIQSTRARRTSVPEVREKRNKQAKLFNLLTYAVLALVIVVGVAMNPGGNSTTSTTSTVSTYRGFLYDSFGDDGIIIYEYTRNARRVRIPDTIGGKSVRAIGTEAFFNRPNMISVTIPDSVEQIGSRAFQRCTGLTEIIIPDSVISIGYNAFSECRGLTEVIIPGSVTSIGSSAFSSCTSLLSIDITDSVISIGDEVFRYCKRLENINIPDSVTSIGANAFTSTAWLDAQPDGTVYAGKVAYTYKGDITAVKTIEILTGTKSIGDSLFRDAVALTEISIPDSVMNIGVNAFRGCTGLTNIVIPDNVESIGGGAFAGCTGLTSVTLGRNLKSIGAVAFAECTGLTSIVIPDSVESIVAGSFSIITDTAYRWDGAFGNCINLSSALYRGETYSVEIIGYWNTRNSDPQYDLPESFYEAVNGN